ncbi:MAG: membrane-associated HD superfamily phosphohydrolase [Paracoccaceae bacterium]|jgi:membrane-associated HD superfamily phosphohydrolase
MTNVFISWSGQQSKEIAEELRNWIPSVLQFAKPYYTPNDIEKGAKWGSEVSQKLSECNVGIVCLTKENFTKPWILFEAGALSKDLKQSKVCSILFGMENTDLTGPLTTFQTTSFSKRDFKNLMNTINLSGLENTLAKETFDRVFEMWWPQLEEKVTTIMETIGETQTQDVRTDRDILEEILTITRNRTRATIHPSGKMISTVAVSDFVETLTSLFEQNRKTQSQEINDILGMQIRVAEYLVMKSDPVDENVYERLDNLKAGQEDFMPF